MFQEIVILYLSSLASVLSETCPDEFKQLQSSCTCQDHNKVICPNPSIDPEHELIVHYDPNDIYFECRKPDDNFLEHYLNKIDFNDEVKDRAIFEGCGIPSESYAKWSSMMNVTFTALVIKKLGSSRSLTSKSLKDLKIKKLILDQMHPDNIQDEDLFSEIKTELTHLVITGPKIPNSNLPDKLFDDLENLESLFLAFMFSSISPKRSWFQDLGKLKTLYLDGFDGSHLHEDVFQPMTNLKNITLGGNNFSFIPEKIFSGNTKLESFEWIYDKCNNCILKPRNFLKGLDQLRKFKIHKNPFASDLILDEDFFEDCQKLEIIEINRSKLQILPENIFRSTKNLEVLDMSHNDVKIPQEIFSSIRKLKVLKLKGNNIQEIHQSHFEKLSDLNHLDLSHNKIKTLDKLAFLYATKMKHLDLSHNLLNFTDQDMPDWKNMKMLQHLDLSFNNVNISPYEFKIIPNLKRLQLNDNAIGPTLRFWQDLQFLSDDLQVDISSNQIEYVQYAGQSHQSKTKAQVNLSQNPLKCSCENLALAMKLREELTIQWVDFEPEDLKCGDGKSLKSVPLNELTCALEICPKDCQCLRVPKNLHLHEELYKCQKVPDFTPAKSHKVTLDLSQIGLSLITSVPETVTKLILSYNNFTSFNLKTSHLHELDIDNNGLNVIDVTKLSHLRSMRIGNNPYFCDCRSHDLFTFVKQNSAKISDVSNVTLACDDLILMTEAKLSDFCQENDYTWFLIIPTVIMLLIMIWKKEEIKMYLYSIPIFKRFCFAQETSKETEYDVFISYANPDAEFAEGILCPTLEKEEFKCLIHVRDFLPGLPITEQISNAIDSSMVTLIVLSKHFLESTWGQHEFSVAHRRGKKIIVILQEDVTKEDMPLTLSDFIQNYTYLSSTDKWFWKKLFYSLPHKKGHKQNCFPCLNRSRNQSSPMSLQNM